MFVWYTYIHPDAQCMVYSPTFTRYIECLGHGWVDSFMVN